MIKPISCFKLLPTSLGKSKWKIKIKKEFDLNKTQNGDDNECFKWFLVRHLHLVKKIQQEFEKLRKILQENLIKRQFYKTWFEIYCQRCL